MTLDDKDMLPRRPYILRALYDWIVDNELTPHIVVDANFPGTEVPREYVKDGQIVLNIDTAAVGALSLGDSDVEFSARFGGQPRKIRIPIGAVVAIYARENGAGTIFEPEEGLKPESEPSQSGPTVVDDSHATFSASDTLSSDQSRKHAESSDAAGKHTENQSEPPRKPPKKGKPDLKVIK